MFKMQGRTLYACGGQLLAYYFAAARKVEVPDLSPALSRSRSPRSFPRNAPARRFVHARSPGLRLGSAFIKDKAQCFTTAQGLGQGLGSVC